MKRKPQLSVTNRSEGVNVVLYFIFTHKKKTFIWLFELLVWFFINLTYLKHSNDFICPSYLFIRRNIPIRTHFVILHSTAQKVLTMYIDVGGTAAVDPIFQFMLNDANNNAAS